ncbi:MAG: hypothetical protein EA420_03175 [Candidatus Competibacteraceae bacterium]|nr:MAG: hypothetical protein EA420_03175 [Candidatus Competibacteraceae bacterium]
MSVMTRLKSLLGTVRWPGWTPQPGTEIGRRSTEENALRYQYQRLQPDFALRATILDIRRMDRLDPRVKKIHGRMARAATKGGLRLEMKGGNERVRALWQAFETRLGLDRQSKLESDARGLVMEGSLAVQWVVNDAGQIVQAVRMPIETLVPQVGPNGRIQDPAKAWAQFDLNMANVIAWFPLWQLTVERLSPDSVDDQGALGRPYLDATRSPWQMLRMTEEDLVIRRRQRAPLRFAHVLENAKPEELANYRQTVEHSQQHDAICTDFYLNRKGGVTALQGDANLDQIADVQHLLETFFTGAPAPKALFGWSGDINRDILEDLKKDFFEEIDTLQDTVSWVYEQGFRLQLLLAGINPDAHPLYIRFIERRTETPNQAADRALKYQALGVPSELCWEAAGLDPAVVAAAVEDQRKKGDPYPNPLDIAPAPRVPRISITPNNAPKGESATNISSGRAA